MEFQGSQLGIIVDIFTRTNGRGAYTARLQRRCQ
jgi:hypothetical protein